MPRIIELPQLPNLNPTPGTYWLPVETASTTSRLSVENLAPAITHSALGDLGADDHPQYLTESRAEQRYAPLWHSHPYDEIDCGGF